MVACSLVARALRPTAKGELILILYTRDGRTKRSCHQGPFVNGGEASLGKENENNWQNGGAEDEWVGGKRESLPVFLKAIQTEGQPSLTSSCLGIKIVGRCPPDCPTI